MASSDVTVFGVSDGPQRGELDIGECQFIPAIAGRGLPCKILFMLLFQK